MAYEALRSRFYAFWMYSETRRNRFSGPSPQFTPLRCYKTRFLHRIPGLYRFDALAGRFVLFHCPGVHSRLPRHRQAAFLSACLNPALGCTSHEPMPHITDTVAMFDIEITTTMGVWLAWGGIMSGRRSLMLKIGVGLAVIGCVLIAKPFDQEPLWVQWMLGFPLFYIGVPLAIVGAALYFVGAHRGPQDSLSPTAHK